MAGEGLMLISATIAAAPRRAQAARLRAARAMGEQAPAGIVVVHGFERVLVDGEVEAGADMLERAVAGGRLLAEVEPGSPFPFIAANGLIVAGRYAVAEAFVNTVIADAAGRGSIWAFVLATAQRGLLRLRQGRIEAAAADAQASLDNAEGRTPVQLAVASAALAGARAAMGDFSGARAALANVEPHGARPDTHIGVVVQESRARLALAEQRWEETLAAAMACAEWEREFEVRHGGWPTWRAYAASAHAALGEVERGRELAAEGVALARRYGVPRTLGLSLRGAGLVESGPAAIELLRESVAVLEAGSLRAEAAGALCDLGSALADADRIEEARTVLDRALATAEATGGRATETLARDALVELGARPRRRSVVGRTALTPAERRVAELAAGGASNRDVAEGLFLTPKTVENHLTSVYRKLGIGSRAQLADHLA
jgi:DNA-binding CsgD family transcriptional regulator